MSDWLSLAVKPGHVARTNRIRRKIDAMPDWLFDRAACQLSKGSTCAQLTPKAAAVLDHLMRRQGEVVSRKDVLDNVWNGLHVTPHLVREYIFDLRSAPVSPNKTC